VTKTLTMPLRKLPFNKLAGRIQPAEGLVRDDWENHPNGGGWVQKTAFAAATAFIGPLAIVCGNARVLDWAQVLDEAMITDTAMIANRAVVAGTSRVGGHAKIIGTARVLGDSRVGGEFYLSEGDHLGGVSLGQEHRFHRKTKAAVQLQLGV
jgi:UDP-3-O-[3-hydroxymyristoyl] glucosamine N-acyltransferase